MSSSATTAVKSLGMTSITYVDYTMTSMIILK